MIFLCRAHVRPFQDLMVRLAGAELLSSLLDSPSLLAAELADFASPICQNMLGLLGSLTELDLHLHLLPTLRAFIERLEQHVCISVPSIA